MILKQQIPIFAIAFVVVCIVAIVFVRDEQQQMHEDVEEGPSDAAVAEEDKNASIDVPNATEKTDQTKMQQTESQPHGIHIMADGTLMAEDGTIITDARILPNGNVELSSGVIVIPVFDLRTQADTPPVSIDIVGSDFEYDIKQIRVKKGDTVTINLKSVDGFHDWVIDEFEAASTRINEGDETSVTFVADTIGTFQYYCSVMNHRERGMVGYLIVE